MRGCLPCNPVLQARFSPAGQSPWSQVPLPIAMHAFRCQVLCIPKIDSDSDSDPEVPIPAMQPTPVLILALQEGGRRSPPMASLLEGGMLPTVFPALVIWPVATPWQPGVAWGIDARASPIGITW